MAFSHVTDAQKVKYPGTGPNDTIKVYRIIVDGDTMPFKWIPTVCIDEKRKFKNNRDEIRYTKLRRDVLRVLPYARMAGKKYRDLAGRLALEKSEANRNQMTKATEKEILDKFEPELKKLTITQGRILLKLIDRETDHTSYEILKEWRSGFTAFFWQGVARIFGSNLKSEYDTETERDIESIIMSVEGDTAYDAPSN